jgi:hypothetical protein
MKLFTGICLWMLILSHADDWLVAEKDRADKSAQKSMSMKQYEMTYR